MSPKGIRKIMRAKVSREKLEKERVYKIIRSVR